MAVDGEDELLRLYRGLDARRRRELMHFARGLDLPATPPRPEPRPEGESVVLALRRLTRSYPMLDRRRLMGPASTLMAQHALQGRAASEVIDELELVFERHYLESRDG
ncbi:MAG: hypothetical protein KF804_01245 [Burkholderiales bacterium]|jgi:hypothetical protein|nr:hypothetical protein [Burkholderiales bacterium]